ncbi:hypothetical protein LV779_37470 [Streptomyces thinghirensis]|nr:hypothetical protein [Streptomyces thinghirensis]
MFANVPAAPPPQSQVPPSPGRPLATLAPTAPALAAGRPDIARPGAEVVAVTQVADRQIDLSVRSRALRRPHSQGPPPDPRRLEPRRPAPTALAHPLAPARLLRRLHLLDRDDRRGGDRQPARRAGRHAGGRLERLVQRLVEPRRGGDPAWETFHTVRAAATLLETRLRRRAATSAASLLDGNQGCPPLYAPPATPRTSRPRPPTPARPPPRRRSRWPASWASSPARTATPPPRLGATPSHATPDLRQAHDPFHLARAAQVDPGVPVLR